MGRPGYKVIWHRGGKKEIGVVRVPSFSASLAFLGASVLLFAAACGPDFSVKNKPAPANTEIPNRGELELSGVYNVSGAGENSLHPYEGILTITNDRDVYVFKWQTTRAKPGGVGVQMGDAVAVTNADPTSGKGCGVALYKIASDGSLDGRVVRWGENTYGAERAIKVAGDNFDGKYTVTGTAGDGRSYEGTIDVEKNGKGYVFTWTTGKDMVGFGIWRGDRAAIGFGGKQCSFGLYKVISARSLEGHWGSQRDVVFGTENAKRP